MLALGDGSYCQAKGALSDLCIPEDQVYQVAPGVDVGAIPPEQLISITGSVETQHSTRTEAAQFGDYVICKRGLQGAANCVGLQLGFVMEFQRLLVSQPLTWLLDFSCNLGVMSIDHYKRTSPGAFVRWYHPEMAQSNFWRRAKEKDIGLAWCLAPGGGHGYFGTLLAFIAQCLDGVSSCSKSPDVLNVMTLWVAWPLLLRLTSCLTL